MTAVEWRYLPTGRVRHALAKTDHVGAACGLSVWRAWDWHGTGSQREYETVAGVPECRSCVKAMSR